ncbi:MAG: hypothetical protein M1470_04090 [Bacteroidetes bacterium]|nr:hypothetical protein [Bacteroidota bacterium]MCL5738755.1 hypothetical protein [Bacteroidota bacterium]
MRNTSKTYLTCFLMLLIVSAAEAQTNPVYQKMLQNGWRYPFENGFRKLTPAELDAEACSSMGYDDSAVANLKKLGVDVKERWKTLRWDEKMWAALSDCIVIGTVSRTEHPSWPRPWFHTVAFVDVEEFLRNDYGLPKGEVAVMEVSGPTGRGSERVTQIGEDTLNVGEHVLLFLGASSLITFASDNNMVNLYNHLINDPRVWFELLAKYDLKSREAYFKGRKEGLSSLQHDVTTVLNVIHRSTPSGR